MSLIDDYIQQGWSLVPVPQGSKGPRAPGWNLPAAAIRSSMDLTPFQGVGLMHAYSGTMALDIDDWMLTRKRIDIDALYAAPDAVTILSGKPGRGKLLYKMPFGLTLPTKKFEIDDVLAFELRCGTMNERTVQDVLPPSIHPETGRPYEWGGTGHWTRLPIIPGVVLDIWQAALKNERPAVVNGVNSSWSEIRNALFYINSDCSRQEWINCGMALHWAGEQTFNAEEGFYLWDEWSRRGEKYPGERAIAQQWGSFRTNKQVSVTLGTLYQIAGQYGWIRPQPDASTLFGAVKPAEPTDVMRLLRPSPPSIDLDLWPKTLAQRAREVSDGVGCDPVVPLWAGLGAVCGVIDAQIRLELLPDFKVPPVLWLMTIGEPADKKTPGSKPMLEPLADIEIGDRQRFAQDVLTWELQEASYKNARTAAMTFAGTPDFIIDKTQTPDIPDLPPKPIPLRIKVSDVTSQKLIHIAAERPRGLLCELDEMHGWVTKLCSRMSGEDRSSWVQSYESSRYDMSRIGAGDIRCDNLAVSIYGNIQPRVFDDNYHALTSDGLLQRFLPAVLDGTKTRLGNPLPACFTSAPAYDGMLRLVFSLQVQTYRLSTEARAVYRAFQVWYEDRKRTERLVRASGTYMTAYGKLEGLLGRLALIFHVIESPFNPEVSASVVERCVEIIKGYVIPVYRYLYDKDDDSSSTFDLWVTEHIIHHSDLAKISLSDIKKSARRPFEAAGIKNTGEQSQWVLNAMALLENRGWVARADDGSLEHRGTAEWFINPHLQTIFADHRKAVVQAKVDRESGRLSRAEHYRGSIIHGADLLDEV